LYVAQLTDLKQRRCTAQTSPLPINRL